VKLRPRKGHPQPMTMTGSEPRYTRSLCLGRPARCLCGGRRAGRGGRRAGRGGVAPRMPPPGLSRRRPRAYA
jgi:hypothetical protein